MGLWSDDGQSGAHSSSVGLIPTNAHGGAYLWEVPTPWDDDRKADFPISMILNGVSVLISRAPIYPMHREEFGLIEVKESGALFIRQRTPAGSPRSTFPSLLFVP